MQASTDAVRRKGALAVYRATRVQITRFEEAFLQLHGRRPKGAIEKAPLATTYAQYRESKRFIRTDAARRIQALFRGARTRWMLQRNEQNHSQVFKLVQSRVIKRTNGALTHDSDHSQIIYTSFSALDEIRAPAEIIHDDNNNRIEESPLSNYERDDPSLDSSQDSSQESEVTLPIEPAYVDSPMPELPLLSLPELRARKRELKHRLKEYDMKFMIEHGRMPDKVEKEPIRYLYDRYNALKDLIGRKALLVPGN